MDRIELTEESKKASPHNGPILYLSKVETGGRDHLAQREEGQKCLRCFEMQTICPNIIQPVESQSMK